VRFPLVLLAVLSFALPALAQEERLGEAKQLLAGIAEGHVKQGTQICVEANSVKSIELLLDVLKRTERLAARALAPGHYRDIVWDGLLRITDPYARERVAKLARSHRNPWVRQWCVELLGIWGDREFGDVVIKACRDRHDSVRRWAARSLGVLKHEQGEPALLKLRRDRDPYVRANAIEALARIDAKKHGLLFREALGSDEDGGVRCALLGAVPGIFPAEVVALSTAALKDEDWRPRLQAVDNLRRKEKAAVDGLVAAARDGRPVVADRAMKYLRELTGKEIRDADAWAGWWRTSRDTFKFPEEKKPEEEAKPDDESKPEAERKTVAFNQIPLVSDHVAFLIDKSIMMKRTLDATVTTKDLAAYRELKQVLEQLHGRLVFNVFCYREDVEAFRKEPVELDDKQEKRALRFVAQEELKGAKDIWKVLEQVVSDPDIDTAYLLSSGEPDVGLYVHWNRVTRHLADLNRFHKVVVHCVVYSERKWFRDQLEKIAQTTGGDFKWFK
jgi:hypothetical protein